MCHGNAVLHIIKLITLDCDANELMCFDKICYTPEVSFLVFSTIECIDDIMKTKSPDRVKFAFMVNLNAKSVS